MRGRKPSPETIAARSLSAGAHVPTRPDWLDGDALAEWDRVIGELAQHYHIAPLDAMTLAAYCRAYAMWRQADREVAEKGLTFESDNGNIRVNPAAKLCLSLFQELRRMAAEFGFTPAARSRINPPAQISDEEDSFDTL